MNHTLRTSLVTSCLLAFAWCAACGGRSSGHLTTAPTNNVTESADSEASPPEADNPQGTISFHFQKISEWRLSAGLPAEPLTSAVSLATPYAAEDIDSAKALPRSKKCIDTCRVKTSICESAETICELANGLVGDLWAAEKCNSSKASCQESVELCTDCIAAESPVRL